ncbi:MAG: histidine kinase [Ideonella sp.]
MANATTTIPRSARAASTATRPRGEWSADWSVLWRQVQLAAALSGGLGLMISLGALSAVGNPSPDFWMFTISVSLTWFVSVLAQLGALHWLRRQQLAGVGWLLLRFVFIALVAIAVHIASFNTRVYSARLGLTLPARTTLTQPIWIVIWVSVFLIFREEGVRRQASAAMRLQSLQAAQIAARRRVVESQLRALQARVNPQLFFDLLDAVERLYPADPRRAEALLDELIVFLRAALPRLNSASSCLAQELALAQSYMHCRALAGDGSATFDAELSEGAQDLAFPAGLLLPLLTGIAPVLPANATLRLTASVCAAWPLLDPQFGAALGLVLDAPVALPTARAEDTQRTLRALYGDAAVFRCEPAGSGRFHHFLGIPLETA